MEARACDRAATGVVRGAVEAERVVHSCWLGSAGPCEGTACMRVTVGSMDSKLIISDRASGVCIVPVAAYKSSSGQGSHPYTPSTYIHSLSAW